MKSVLEMALEALEWIAKEAFEAGWRYAVKHACAGEK